MSHRRTRLGAALVAAGGLLLVAAGLGLLGVLGPPASRLPGPGAGLTVLGVCLLGVGSYALTSAVRRPS